MNAGRLRRHMASHLVLTAAVALAACGSPNPNVATYHNDNLRTGAYLAETVLTPAAVRSRGMRIKFWVPPCAGGARPRPGPAVGCLDGAIATQPLFIHSVRFQLRLPMLDSSFELTAPAVFFATTSNTAYALHAETGQLLWKTYLMLDPQGAALAEGHISGWVVSTPVIDAANNRMYVTFSTKNQHPHLPDCLERVHPDPARRDAARRQAERLYVQHRLTVLDIRTGEVLAAVPIAGSVRRRDGTQLAFVGKHHVNHPALLLHDGSVYVAFGSPAWSEGCVEYHGWVFRYDAASLALRGVFNTSADWRQNGSGSGIWQGGGGLAADGGGIYFITGNGRADTSLEAVPGPYFTNRRLYGNTFLKLRPRASSFQVQSFAPPDANELDKFDADLGSGGLVLIPGSNVLVGGGKSGYLYVLDRSSMAKLQHFEGTTNLYDPDRRGDTWDKGPHMHGSPTYWSGPESAYGLFYVWGEKDVLRIHRFDKSTQTFAQASFRKGTVRALSNIMPGGMLSVSANGTRRGTGIVWATLPVSDWPSPYPGALYAFDAETLDFLWDTPYGAVAHWVPPTVAQGKVFVAEGNGFKPWTMVLTAYELGRPDGSDRVTRPATPPQHPKACQSCHSGALQAPRAIAMSDHHDTGGAVRMKPGLALDLIAPPEGYAPSTFLEGTGMQTYEARRDPQTAGSLAWTLAETTADLSELNPAARERGEPMRVRLAEGSVWYADDGSTVVARLERSTPAPKSIDMDWALFATTAARGDGFLSHVGYIRQVYTHAGRPPAKPPSRPGEIVRVPFVAEYWLYR